MTKCKYDKMKADKILEKFKNNEISLEEAKKLLSSSSFVDLGFAKIDTNRKIRCGHPEVIFSEKKTTAQLKKIIESLIESGENNIIATRINLEQQEMLVKTFKNIEINSLARLCVINPDFSIKYKTKVGIITGGTSDMPVAEEAAVTLSAIGIKTEKFYDCGVAGIHRLFDKLGEIIKNDILIVIAGMEGALGSVVGGLVNCPIIAVPTSVGYGANFNGLSALLSMLNSCASGMTVVNIDNGFGAAYAAAKIVFAINAAVKN